MTVHDVRWHLNGPVQLGLFPAVVKQASDGDPVGEVVDERDVVDQVVRLSDAQDHNGGSALWEIQRAE